ncbi:MAG: CocE/NonD family hydrolase [Vicinamibacterales bacterium]
MRRHLVLSCAVICASAVLFSQGLDEVKATYTKREVYIPMRDGARLFTTIYTPKDQSQSWPIMMTRTPYSVAPYGADRYRTGLGPSELFGPDGFIFVYQDVRGRWMSEGTFDHMRPHAANVNESKDTYDTIEWLMKNVPGHNGRAGMWGISYPGFYTAAGMIDAHPALKAASPQAPVADWFTTDDWHHNGAFMLAHAFGWFSGAGWPFEKPTTVQPGTPVDLGTEDGYDFYLRLGPLRNANEKYFKRQLPFWNDMMAHGTYDDFWKARNIRPHLKAIRPAVMTVGGWFDAENLFGALEIYHAVEKLSPGAFNILVMGPWVHGGWARDTGDSLGDVRFDAPTAAQYRERIELPFFRAYLKGDGKPDLPEASMFETGSNQWRSFEAWPPKDVKPVTLYLHAGGRLLFDAPAAEAANAFDEYPSDPKSPIPLVPGIARGMAQRYMVDDQRFAARRPDVLTYVSDALEDTVTLAGPVVPSLWFSTSGTDQDVVVKLIDVYPSRYPDAKGETSNTLGNYHQLVRGDVMRGKFRTSLEKPEPFAAGQATKVEFEIKDTFHTFRRGHRMMVQIQSTWFPLIDINPGKFMDIYAATDADFQKTTQRVYRSKSMASGVKVGILR